MRRHVGAVVVVVVVVLAGCNGAFGGATNGTSDGSSNGSTASAPAGDRLAPGLTEAGVVNASALAAAHESFLEDRSFTRTTNTTARAANGSAVVTTESVVRAGPAGGRLDSVVRQRGSAPSIATGGVPARREVWTGGGEVFVNSTYANGTTRYGRLPANASGRSGAASAGVEYALESYGPANTSVTERQRNGSTVYVVTNDEQAANATTSLELTVDDRGVIHEFRTETNSSAGTVAQLVRTTRFSAVGTTEVPDRPGWVETAKDRTLPTGTDRTNPATNGTTVATGAATATDTAA